MAFFQLRRIEFVRFKKKKGDWKTNGGRGWEDVKIIVFCGESHSSVVCQMKVWLSYCVFTGSVMIEGLRTSFILGGEKCTISSVCLEAQTCSSSFPCENRAVVKRFSQHDRSWALPYRTVSQPASWLTGCSVCRLEWPASSHTAVIPVTWSKSSWAKAVCCCQKLQTLGKSLFFASCWLKAGDV